jgi:hypothetical protein
MNDIRINRNVIRLSPVLALALLAGTAHAIIIRHDKNDALYKALAANAKYDAVGLFEWKRNGVVVGFATGNYIGVGTGGKKWLVTAAHVLDREWDSATFTIGGRTYNVQDESAKWREPYSSGKDDIGVIRILDPDSRLTVAPARFWNALVPIPGSLDQRLTGVSVGFGITGNGNTGGTTEDKAKRAMQNKVDALEMKYNSGRSTKNGYLVDFDKNDADSNRLDRTDFPAGNYEEGQKSSRTWLDLEGQCDEGDSGGGLFVTLNDMDVMIGIASSVTRLGDGDLGKYGSMTQYAPFTKEMAGHIERWTGIKAVPEPSTLSFLLVGGAGLLARRLRRK